VPAPHEGSEAHARGLPLLGAIRAAFLPKQGVPSAPAPRLQRAWRYIAAEQVLIETSRRRCIRAQTPSAARLLLLGTVYAVFLPK
jgi:hypothetical protein